MFMPRQYDSASEDWLDKSLSAGDYGLTGFTDGIMIKPKSLPSSNARAEKRYFCRPLFVYNPVTGRCQPSLKVNSERMNE